VKTSAICLDCGKGQVILQVALLLLKYILRDDLAQHLEGIFELLGSLSDRQTGLEYLETILRYLSAGTDKLSEAELNQAITKIFIEGEEIMPTLAEKWIEQGIEQGREEGREEATLNVLRQFLVHRFGISPNRFDEALQSLSLDALTTLSYKAFSMEDLTDFETALADLTTNTNKKQ